MPEEVITASETHWRYEEPEDRAAKRLLLTTGRVAIVGPWLKGDGVIAWCPLPKRDKQKEKELGLL
jgi:hypothetical protein